MSEQSSNDSSNNKGTLILLDGIPGSGKTLLAKSLKAMLDDKGKPCKVYIEECDKVKLDRYIRNMKKYAYSFQLETALNKCKVEGEAIAFARAGGIAIVDRSLLGDWSFVTLHAANGFISREQLLEYSNKVITAGANNKPANNLYITCSVHLSVDPDVALRRIKRRGTQAEKDKYTVEYLGSLDEAFRGITANIRGDVTIMEFDWNKELPVVNGVVQPEWLRKAFKVSNVEEMFTTASSDRDRGQSS